MKKNQLLFLAAFGLVVSIGQSTRSQNVDELSQVIIVSGGMFEFSPPYADYVTVTSLNRFPENVVSDTIYTQSAQDLLIDSNHIYVAAADSVVKYDLSLNRLAVNAFGAPSTIKMVLYGQYLIVGNWYGSSDNNLRIFNKNDLSYVDSIPEIAFGAKDMVVVGDSLYVQQNHTDINYGDSAGFLSVVDLSQMKYVRDIHFANGDEDLGRLQAAGNVIYAFNAASNTVTTYNITNGGSSTVALPGDIQVWPYGQQLQLYKDTIYFKYENGLAAYDYKNATIAGMYLVDTPITAFAYDYLNDWFALTQTDFGTYTRGSILHRNGIVYDTLPVAFSPEAIGLVYSLGTGVEEYAKPVSFDLYPNPASGIVHILPGTDEEYLLQVYSTTGLIISEQNHLEGRQSINIYDYPSGMYLIRFTNSQGAVTKRFVKQY